MRGRGVINSRLEPISSISQATRRGVIITLSVHLRFFIFARIRIRRSAPVTNLFAASLESAPLSIASAQFMITYPASNIPGGMRTGSRVRIATLVPKTHLGLGALTWLDSALAPPQVAAPHLLDARGGPAFGQKKRRPEVGRRRVSIRGRSYLPTTNTQLVVPLPPMFSIAVVFAPST